MLPNGNTGSGSSLRYGCSYPTAGAAVDRQPTLCGRRSVRSFRKAGKAIPGSVRADCAVAENHGTDTGTAYNAV